MKRHGYLEILLAALIAPPGCGDSDDNPFATGTAASTAGDGDDGDDGDDGADGADEGGSAGGSDAPSTSGMATSGAATSGGADTSTGAGSGGSGTSGSGDTAGACLEQAVPCDAGNDLCCEGLTCQNIQDFDMCWP